MVSLRLGLLYALLAAIALIVEPSAALTWPTSATITSQAPFLAGANWLISSLLSPWSSDTASAHTTTKHFQHRKIYHQGTHSYRGLSASFDYADTFGTASVEQAADIGAIRTTRVTTWRPKNIAPFLEAHSRGDDFSVREESGKMDWDEIEVDGPDVTDRHTLLTLSKMAAKAYDAPKNGSDDSWVVGGGKWYLSESFGWVEDGIRGHIFSTPDNSTVVVALKGTSAALLDDGSTSKRDKENDNLLFSCCCAHVGWTWHTVCDCYDPNSGLLGSTSTQSCSNKCLTKALIKQSFFYPATTDLFNNISYAYPDAQIWITGHSLGGALGALIGMTFGYPTVTFEAPAERMAALRLHLPLPKKHGGKLDALPITHVYHTGDPIPMGECVGAISLCANFGFAMESKCHTGKTVLYDTVGKLGWASSVASHRIATLTDDLLNEDWDKKVEKAGGKSKAAARSKSARSWWGRLRAEGDEEPEKNLGAVPRLRDENDCVDCEDWKFTE